MNWAGLFNVLVIVFPVRILQDFLQVNHGKWRETGASSRRAATLHAVIDSAVYCHVPHIIDDRPVATTTLHWRKDDRLYWHGSVASRQTWMHRSGPGLFPSHSRPAGRSRPRTIPVRTGRQG